MSPRSAIVVIDLLKGFFRSNPTLPDPLDAKRLFATVRRVIDGGRERGVTIVFIKDNFLPEEVPIDKHFKIFGPHCIIGTPDAEIVDELDPKPGDFQIQKKHYSAFNSTRLDAVLRELEVKQLFFTGAWTEACVQHTVIDAFYLNYDISVISDAVSSPHRDAHDYALNYMRQYHRAKIITSDQALAQFRADAVATASDERPAPPAAARPSYAEWGRASRTG
jgi:nicotinamidase-related amidase